MDTPDTHNQIMYKLGQLEGKLDSSITSISDVKSAVVSLRDDFGKLEAGRLSRLELSFNTLKTETASNAKWSGLWTSAIISIIVGVAVVVITHFIK